MTTDQDTILRKALDAVDRHKKRLYGAFAAVFIFSLVTQYRLVTASHTGDLSKLIIAAVVVLEVWTAVWAVAIVLQFTVATKRILRAIELASNK